MIPFADNVIALIAAKRTLTAKLFEFSIPRVLPGMDGISTSATQSPSPMNINHQIQAITITVDASAFSVLGNVQYSVNAKIGTSNSVLAISWTSSSSLDAAGNGVLTNGVPFAIGTLGVIITLSWGDNTSRIFNNTSPFVQASWAVTVMSVAKVSAITWYYTNFQRTITFNGHDYASAPLELMNGAGGSGDLERAPFTINNAYLEPFVSFSGGFLQTQVKCIVRDVMWDGAEWIGYIRATGTRIKTKRNDNQVAVDFQPFAAAISKNIPGVLYQRLDARMPYWDGFSVIPEAVRLTGCTVNSIAENVLVSAGAARKVRGIALNTASPSEVDYYKGGYIEYSRQITGVDGQTFTLPLRVQIVNNTVDPLNIENSFFTLRFPPPFLSDVEDENTFSAIPGYDGTPYQAQNKFGNFAPDLSDASSDGFVGFPHIPRVNYTTTPVEKQ